jgi:hypothetical protein
LRERLLARLRGRAPSEVVSMCGSGVPHAARARGRRPARRSAVPGLVERVVARFAAPRCDRAGARLRRRFTWRTLLLSCAPSKTTAVRGPSRRAAQLRIGRPGPRGVRRDTAAFVLGSVG